MPSFPSILLLLCTTLSTSLQLRAGGPRGAALRSALRASEADDLLEQAKRLRAEAAALEDVAAPTTAPPATKPALTADALAKITTDRDAYTNTLGDLRTAGAAKRWMSRALSAEGAEVPTEARVRAATGIDGARDLLTQEEVGNEELFQLTAGVFVGSGALAIASGSLIGGNVGATFTYLFAVLPILFLGVGSSSPGVIVALYQLIKGSGYDAERRRRHEAAHLVAGHTLGLPVADFSAGDDPQVEFYDVARSRYTRDDAEVLACVALSGAVAECDSFGSAKGAQGDFAQLQTIFDRTVPKLSPKEQQAATRRACMNAYAVLYGSRARRDGAAVEAVDAAMAAGASLPEVIAALENA
mmetsp:Transcript_25164/g.75555  ORF Transcript_25164/g.75555 Transcript_25164/m.75555 type:complete len:357 (+) Transcript_25164:118-1188(+)